MGAVGRGQSESARQFLRTGLLCFCLSLIVLLCPSCLKRTNNAFVTAAHQDDADLTTEIAKFSQNGILRNLSLLTQDLRVVASPEVVHNFEGRLLLDLADNYASFADPPEDRYGHEAWLKEKQIRLVMQLLDRESLGKYLASLENMPPLTRKELDVGIASLSEYLEFHLSQLKAHAETARVFDKEKLFNENLYDALQRQQALRRTHGSDLPLALSQAANASPKIVAALEATSDAHEAGEWWISVASLRERLLWNDEDYCFFSDLWCTGEWQSKLGPMDKMFPACRTYIVGASLDTNTAFVAPGALFLTIEQNLQKARGQPKIYTDTRMRRRGDDSLHRVVQAMCMWFLSPLEELTRGDTAQVVSNPSRSVPRKDVESEFLSEDLLSNESVHTYSARIRRAVDDRLSRGMTALLGKNSADIDPGRIKRLKRDALYLILSQRDLTIEVEKETGQPRRELISKGHIKAGDQFIEKEKFLVALYSWTERNRFHGLEEYNRASFFPVTCGDDGTPGRKDRKGNLAKKIATAIKARGIDRFSIDNPEASQSISLCLMWVFELERQLRLLEI